MIEAVIPWKKNSLIRTISSFTNFFQFLAMKIQALSKPLFIFSGVSHIVLAFIIILTDFPVNLVFWRQHKSTELWLNNSTISPSTLQESKIYKLTFIMMWLLVDYPHRFMSNISPTVCSIFNLKSSNPV